MDTDLILQTAKRAAEQAAEHLMQGFRGSFDIRTKDGRHDLVTEYDTRAERIIVDEIVSLFPTHNILGEEGGSIDNGSDYTWIVDPLDGTVNFAHGVPAFSVSIGVQYKQELVVGVVHHPPMSDVFWAEKGKGAFRNNTKLAVSITDNLHEALVVTGFPYNAYENPGKCIDTFGDVIRAGVSVRRLGSAALDLCYVAAGHFDAFWEVKLNPWDVAAGKLILLEAGGTITNYLGEPHLLDRGTLLASNGLVHRQLSGILSMQGGE